MAKTIKLTYDEACPDCKWESEFYINLCDKHWAMAGLNVVARQAERDIDKELRRLMIEGE